MSMMQAMMYKIDFALASVTVVVYFLTQFLLIKMFFVAGGVLEIGGYRENDLYFVFTLAQLVVFTKFFVFRDSARITTNQIHTGSLDYILLRPASEKFLVTFQSFKSIHSFAILLYVIVALPYLYCVGGYNFNIFDWLTVLYLLFIGVLVYAIVYWIAVLLNFVWPRFHGLWMFVNEIGDIMKYPKNIYPDIVENFLTYIIPIFLVVNPVFKVIDNSFEWNDFWEINLVTLVFVLVYVLLWKVGLRRYNSAN